VANDGSGANTWGENCCNLMDDNTEHSDREENEGDGEEKKTTGVLSTADDAGRSLGNKSKSASMMKTGGKGDDDGEQSQKRTSARRDVQNPVVAKSMSLRLPLRNGCAPPAESGKESSPQRKDIKQPERGTPNRKVKRLCSVDGCTRIRHNPPVSNEDSYGPPGGRCKRNGGGAKCSVHGCTSFSQGSVFHDDRFGSAGIRCSRHGGGTK